MKYYEDLIASTDKMGFIIEAINEHKGSQLYSEACDAYEYFKKRNVTITKFRKILYKLTGEAIPDPFSSNYKFCNGFFPIFTKQENSFLLGNGVTFNNDSTKEKLGGDDFDTNLYNAGEYALWGAVSFIFFNYDHLNVFKVTEFVPLVSYENGALRAGIRFWQVDPSKPLRATLYEEDGYTEYIWEKDSNGRILKNKKSYTQIVRESAADGIEIRDGGNYPSFPIVPLWANKEHQSELTGLREKIDGYDLIQSGFANNIDEAQELFWIIQNAGGMDEIDLAAFLDQLRRVHAAVVDDNGAKAEPHTMDVPYEARQACLENLRDSLFRDAMALDTDKITAGNVTATAIDTAYENLELKCDGYEYCVTECIKSLLALIGVDDAPTYHRRKTTNQPEVTNMILAAAQYLDDETILKHLPFLNIDEVDDILKRREKEEAARFADDLEDDEDEGQSENPNGQEAQPGGEQDQQDL